MNVLPHTKPALLRDDPWRRLPSRMKVLHITTSKRTSSLLSEALTADRATRVDLEGIFGITQAMARLQEVSFDAILISHEPTLLDAFGFVPGLRAGGCNTPVIVLSDLSEQKLTTLCYEVGADGCCCAPKTTTRSLLWIVARAVQHQQLIDKNQELSQAEKNRLRQERQEAQLLLDQQKTLIHNHNRKSQPAMATEDHKQAQKTFSSTLETSPVHSSLFSYYREMLRAHVIMGVGNLSSEMENFIRLLSAARWTAPQIMELHVLVLEELIRSLGSRSAKHVMNRGDLLILEVMIHLVEGYRTGDRYPTNSFLPEGMLRPDQTGVLARQL